MKLTILCVGKTRTEQFEPAIERYVDRLKRWVKLDIDVIPASDVEQESAKLLDRFGVDDTVILLDETGDNWSTPELAVRIEQCRNQSVRSLIFVIGGAYGVSGAVAQRANYVWSLSRLVFPHELVRLMLSEQLYRAYDVLHGGKYHHD